MPGRAEPPRNLGAMRDVQSQRNTPRRSSEFLKNIDAVLSEVDDSPTAREAKKAKNTAEIEKIFPGVEEDEKTLSGMYEPALHNFPLGEKVERLRRPDVEEIPTQHVNSQTFQSHEQLSRFPKSKYHVEEGTGPAYVGPSERRYNQFEESDLDPDTRGGFGTDREERDYIGFQQEGPSQHPIDSPKYWTSIDTRSHNPQVRNAANTFMLREQQRGMEEYAARASASILGTSRRRRNPTNRRSRNSEVGPVTNTRTAAELMAQGNPARAGGRSDGRHHFAGIASPPYSLGRLPRELSPNLRNLETDYTVFSYSTPIAWRTTQGHWEVPRINYSRTTQRHQSAIRRALSNSYHSPLAEASYRVSELRQQHLEQGIRLPSRVYEVNVGFETFHPEPPSEDMINRVVQDHLQNAINPAIERHRRGTRVQRQQGQRNQPQLPLEGGIA